MPHMVVSLIWNFRVSGIRFGVHNFGFWGTSLLLEYRGTRDYIVVSIVKGFG